MRLSLVSQRRSTVSLLWLGTGSLAAVVLTALLLNALLPPQKAVQRKALGVDFAAFYSAGAMVRQGRTADLYSLGAMEQMHRRLTATTRLQITQAAPYWNPPFYVWLFRPLSALPFDAALEIWWGLNAACLLGACLLMMRWMVRSGNRPATAWLVPALVCLSMPSIQLFGHGQNTGLSLLIVCLAVELWRRQQALAAGMVGALLLYKPQLAAVLAAAMVMTLGWRALAGWAMTACGFLVLNALALPGTLSSYLRQLPANLHRLQVEQVYPWERHVTLKALWRLLIQGFEPGPTGSVVQVLLWVSCLAIGCLLLAAVLQHVRHVGESAGQSLDRLIAAVICVTPLLMPFYFDYDLLLLSVAGVLLAANEPGRWMLPLWAGLYVALFVSAPLAMVTHINLAGVAVAGVAGAALSQCLRRRQSFAAVDSLRLVPAPLRSAA